MQENNSTLLASWASYSLAERALAYYRSRIIGNIVIFLSLALIQAIYPKPAMVVALLMTAFDSAVLLVQRKLTEKGKPTLGMWLSLITSAALGTSGLHLSGEYITLMFGVYLILILGAAFVFWRRSAARYMNAIASLFFLILIFLSKTHFFQDNHPLYTVESNAYMLYTQVFLGFILMGVATKMAGGTTEALGNWNIQLNQQVEEKTARLTKLLKEREKTYHAIVTTLANIIEMRDYYTSDHSHRIATLAVETARFLGYDEEALERIRLAAILHDIGKIGVPDEILNKKGKLTPQEYAVIQKHPEIGANIIAGIEGLEDISEVVRAHHERCDGQGYPRGLHCNAIPPEARIITVVDAYIAMTDKRPYKKAKGKAFAIKELIVQSGKHFDPQVVDAFLYVLQLENQPKQNLS